jgi:hypothetical protein
MPKRMPPPAYLMPENRFEFEVELDGEVLTLSVPKLEYLSPTGPAGMRAREAAGKTLNGIETLQLVRDLAKLANPEIADIIDSLDDSQIDWLSDEWTHSSEVTIPESSASPTSSGTTAGPSKRTSSSAATDSAGSAKKTSRSATSSRSSRTSPAKARSRAN